MSLLSFSVFFFFNDTATTEIYTLSLHDALPIYRACDTLSGVLHRHAPHRARLLRNALRAARRPRDRKSTRLNSSHLVISYAVFCLKKKKSRTIVSVCYRRRISPSSRPLHLTAVP